MKHLFILSLLFALSNQLTFDIGNTQQKPERQLKEFKTYLPEIVAKIESLAGAEVQTPAKPGAEATDAQEYKTVLKSKAVISYAAVSKGDANSGVKITFQNDIEKGVLELENVDVEAESKFIEDKYVKPFVGDSKQILGDEQITATVEKAIKESGSFDVANEAGLFKLTEKGQPDESKKLSFIVKINMAGGKTPEVEIHSSYFTSSFLVNIKTEAYINGELKKTLLNALKHAKRMQAFNTSNRDQITHNFKCEDVGEAFSAVCEGAVPSNTEAGSGGTCKLENDQVSFQCVQDADFLKVTAGFSSAGQTIDLNTTDPKPNLFHQGFVTQSLYDLKPVAESLFEEVVEYARRALGHLNPSEQTKIFSDAK